ncbi:MAG: DUF2490 domain-containing protein [Cytophagales bacterium]|nr:DUF2490 domain-containing protein [Cytophagales bacterium]
MKKITISLLLFISIFTISKAQVVSEEPVGSVNYHVGGIFPTYNQNGKITEKWNYSLYSFLSVFPSEQESKEQQFDAQSNAFYLEIAGSYSINPKLSFAGSYTYERVNPFLDTYRNENRVWLQGQYETKLGRVSLKNRLRYDFRFIQNRTTENTDFRPRLRYLLGVSFPFKEEGKTYFAAYEEIFLETYEDRVSIYGENWAFVGVGTALSPKVKIETGLLYIGWILDSRANWLHQYYWQLTLITQLDFKKKND